MCALKWVCLSGRNKGKFIQPSSFGNYLKLMFYVFKDKGIEYNFENDFNNPKEYHGILIDKWKSIRKDDPTFGCAPNEAQFMTDADKRVKQGLENGTIRLDDPRDLLELVMYIIGRYAALQGSTEHHYLLVERIFIGRYGADEDEAIRGLEYIGIYVPWSKTNGLSLKKLKGQTQQKALITIVEDEEAGIANPIPIFKHYLAHLHPDAKYLFSKSCKASANKMAEYKAAFPDRMEGYEVWFYPGQHGESNYNHSRKSIGKFQKNFAKKLGAPNWKHCTNHGLRKLCI